MKESQTGFHALIPAASQLPRRAKGNGSLLGQMFAPQNLAAFVISQEERVNLSFHLSDDLEQYIGVLEDHDLLID